MPLTVLGVLVPAVSLLSATIKATQQLFDLYDDVKDHDRTLLYFKSDLEACKAALDTWITLWALESDNVFSEATYIYFWGPKGYNDVLRLLRCIEADLKDLEPRVSDEYRSRANIQKWQLIPRKVGFAMFDKGNIKERLKRVMASVKNLERITRSQFWATIKGKGSNEGINETLPRELAILKEQTERLWTTLSIIREEMPRSMMVAAKDGITTPLWQLLKGTKSQSSISLDFIDSRDDEYVLLRLRYEADRSIKPEARSDIKRTTEKLLREGKNPVSVVLGSSLQDYFGRLSQRPLHEQSSLRRRSHLDRATVAYEIAQWAILTWNSVWTEEVCICQIYYTFASNDENFKSPFRSIANTKSFRPRKHHACLDQGCAGRRHLRLAIMLASLAMTCQIATVTGQRAESVRFVVYIDGSLRNMDEAELILQIRDRTNDFWHSAVEECLILSHRRELGEEMLAADFDQYDQRVLKPLAANCRIEHVYRTTSLYSIGQYDARSWPNLHTLLTDGETALGLI